MHGDIQALSLILHLVSKSALTPRLNLGYFTVLVLDVFCHTLHKSGGSIFAKIGVNDVGYFVLVHVLCLPADFDS